MNASRSSSPTIVAHRRLSLWLAASLVLALTTGALVHRSAAQQYSWSTFAGAAGVTGSANTPGYFNLPFGIARDSSGNVYVADYGNHVIRMITPGGVISTFAGAAGVAGSADGATTTARFNSPAGVAVDSANNVYVTDFGNGTIRKIAGGTVSTLAGSVGVAGGVDGTGTAASFNGPGQVTCDSAGNLYLGDFFGHTIRKVTPAGVVTTIAGLAGNAGSVDGTGGVGGTARFNEPTGIAVDAQGTVYVCDERNFTIRKITPAGAVTTLAGLAGSPGYGDGTGGAARFTFVYGLAFDSAGNLIVTERGTPFSGSNNLLRKVTPAGVVTTLAGLSGTTGTTADGTGSNARFNYLGGVINDGTGNTLLVVETGSSVIRRVSYDGVCTTWVGTPDVAGAASTVGTFGSPFGIVRDSNGNFFVADNNLHVIRKITPAGVLSTFAGQSGSTGSTDATGGAARFNGPAGLAIDAANNLYVAEIFNHTIRKITPAGEVTTLAGQAGASGSTDGTGSAAQFNIPLALAIDSTGTFLLVTDFLNYTIRKVVIATGAVTTLAGQAGSAGSVNGTGGAARFSSPRGVVLDAAGNAYVTDNFSIRKITPAAVVTTLAGLPGSTGSADGTGGAARFGISNGMVLDGAGNLIVADNHTLRKATPAGVVTTMAGLAGISDHADGVGSAARFADPVHLALDAFGNFYVTCFQDATIRKVTPGGAVSTFAGTPGLFATTNTGGNFNAPNGTAVDGAGNVYVADSNNHTIRQITPAGVIRTLAGTAGAFGTTDGTGAAARFNKPASVCVDAAGANLYVADSQNHSIRKLAIATGEVTTLAGLGGSSGSVDGTGSAARFNNPVGICIDPAGANLYVTDPSNLTIRRIAIAGGVVTTIAGQQGVIGIEDGVGTAAHFYQPNGVAADAMGNVFVTEFGSFCIRKISPGNVVTTLAGQPLNPGSTDGTGAAARFFHLGGVVVDAVGNLFVADLGNNTLRKITAAGVVTTIGGQAGVTGSADGVGSAARFFYPSGIALDPAGNLFIGDTSNHAIRKGSRVGARARLVQPALGAALPAPTTVFQWEAGIGATKYVLYVGTVPGSYNLYAGDEGTNLSRTVSLPPDIKVYVTLYSLIGGTYQSNSYAFDPAPSAKAAIVSPVQGSTLTSSTLNLRWSAATGATQYAIWVGNSYGGYDLGAAGYGVGANTASFTVPTDGGPVYVRLYSLINGAYQWNDYWYVAQSAAGNRPAKLNAPAPNGSTINGGGTTFAWNTDPGVGATSYAIWIGSTPGGYDIYSALTGTGTIAIPSNIPSDGRKIYVTLFSLIGGAYLSNSYYFTCASSAGSQSQPASLFSPTNGSVLAATQAFNWNPASGSAGYALWVGSTPGGYDLYAGNEGTNLSKTVTGLPTDGRVIHATLWSLIGGVYQSSAAWFYAGNAGATQAARLTSHASGQALSDAANTFTWNLGTGVTSNSYALWLGSTPGGYDLYAAIESGTSRALTLPSDGRKIYATLYSLINGAYQGNSYVFTAPKIAATKAVLTSPANTSTLTGSSATFNWAAGAGATKYILYVGSTPGGYDRYVADEGTGLTRTVTNLPTDGRPLYVTLYSLIDGAYQASSYVFNAWQAP